MADRPCGRLDRSLNAPVFNDPVVFDFHTATESGERNPRHLRPWCGRSWWRGRLVCGGVGAEREGW